MTAEPITVEHWELVPDSLEDSRWRDLAELRLVDATTGADPVWPTTVRLATTPTAFVVRFDCAAATVQATMTRYKDKVWQEDAVEVYLQPPGCGPLYEFQLSPIGTFRDLRVWYPGRSGQRYDDTWSCHGARTAATVERAVGGAVTGWRAMFVLPWEAMGASALDQPDWRVGLFRLERNPEEFSALVPRPGRELDFHAPTHLCPLGGHRSRTS